jgi:hypothetical protein
LIASIVSAFGTSGSKGSAFSATTRFSINLTASDNVSPILASTCEASSLHVGIDTGAHNRIFHYTFTPFCSHYAARITHK